MNSPHYASYWPPDGAAHNYCRNPDSDVGAWCYTTDVSYRWGPCGRSEHRNTPYFVSLPSESRIEKELYARLSDLNGVPMFDLWNSRYGPAELDLLPDGAIVFHRVSPSALAYRVSANDASTVKYHRANGVTRHRFDWPTDSIALSSMFVNPQMGLLAMMEHVHTAWARSRLKTQPEDTAMYQLALFAVRHHHTHTHTHTHTPAEPIQSTPLTL